MTPTLSDFTIVQQVLVGVLFYACFIVHELGHVAALRFFGHEAWFKLTWWGAVAGDRYMMLALAPWQLLIVTSAGPVAGMLLALPFAAYFPLWYLLAFNIGVSLFDFLMIVEQAYMGFKVSWTMPAVHIVGREAWNHSLKTRRVDS